MFCSFLKLFLCNVSYIFEAPDICCSLFVRFHCSFVDTGYLAVTLHGTATLHSAVTCGVNWLRCIVERSVVHLNDRLHVPTATVRKLFLLQTGYSGEPGGKCFMTRARKTLPRFFLTPFQIGDLN